MAHTRISYVTLVVCALAASHWVSALAQESRVVGHSASLGERDASITFDMSDGRSLTVNFAAGRVLVEGRVLGQYRPGGALEREWRSLVERSSEFGTTELLEDVAGLGDWDVEVGERPTLKALSDAISALPLGAGRGVPALGEPADRVTVAPIPPIPAVPELPAARTAARAPGGEATPQRAEATQRMEAAGEQMAARAAEITAQALELSARGLEEATRELNRELGRDVRGVPVSVQVNAGGSQWTAVFGNALELLTAFFGLALMGFGMLFFAPRQLEAVADTVWHRFWRSFLTGLFAQPLVVPVFGMMIVGLALTVVGVLLIPFAAVAFVVALSLAMVGGYIAMARTVGEIYVRRKRGAALAQHGSWIALRYIAYGLAGLLAVWLPAVLLGWVPVAGDLALVLAALITWFVATAGFGATILTRGGLRGTIVRKLDRALTDEHYWPSAASPPIASRSASRQRSE